ncbi:MAG TPA: membrane protein insertion efficiency factor YidD [Chthoniobacterales bacterium]
MALAAAAIFDWSRPPEKQVSAVLFQYSVIAPYRSLVRPVTARFVHCRFRPTCSAYAVTAVKTHGFPKGIWLAMRRIVRCGPWTPMGTKDPVPPRT